MITIMASRRPRQAPVPVIDPYELSPDDLRAYHAKLCDRRRPVLTAMAIRD